MTDRIFASHECCKPGMQLLKIINERFKFPFTRITGGDPCAPTGSLLFVLGPSGTYPHPYLYVQSLLRVRNEEAERVRWLTAAMPWALRADLIGFINPKHLGSSGEFDDEHLEAAVATLEELFVA